MGSKTLFHQFNSDHTMDEVLDAAYRAFIPLGGQVMKMGNGLAIKDGKEGVQYGFSADFEAQLNIHKSGENQYNLTCTVNWKMNTLTIVCLVIGIFVLGILWIIPLLYLFIDPSSAYNQAMFSIPTIVGNR
jgi:hypothetical protein